MYLIATYVIYLAISILLTVWVAKTLHKNGRIFLVDALSGNTELADSVNHLLVVGFYLINAGYVTLALRERMAELSLQGAIELLSEKVGLVLLILGAMHFLNLYVLSRVRRKGIRTAAEDARTRAYPGLAGYPNQPGGFLGQAQAPPPPPAGA